MALRRETHWDWKLNHVVVYFNLLFQVIEDLAKFDLLLKLKRGSKEEKYKVEVHKNLEGIFHLNQMQEEL